MPKISKTKTAVLDAFEARDDDWTFADFESALYEAMGSRYGNYQTAKGAGSWMIGRDRHVDQLALTSIWVPIDYQALPHDRRAVCM